MPSGYKHGDTPKRAMVRGTISYLESQGLPVNKSAIFRHFGLSRSQGYAALSIPASKRNDPEWEETRGRPSKISDEDQAKMERVLWDPSYENVSLNWATLAEEAGVDADCNARTLHRTMGTIGYRRCLGCSRATCHKKTRERRVEHANRLIDAYTAPHSWRFVRFSTELHFGFGIDGRMRLLPRVGEKYCETCKAQPDITEWGRDVRRVHAWAAIGHGFKSELVFYEESTAPTNTGLMAMEVYRDTILEKTVKSWMAPAGSHSSFILEEDVEAFAHGAASKMNIAQQWKEDHGLRCHFGCLDSPDLSPLDNLWPAQKHLTTMEPVKDWEPETLRQAAREAWASFDQSKVNIWVDFMPQRLRLVVDSEGRMVPW